MAKPLLLIDFDRTLFDTAAFVDELWEYLARSYHVATPEEQARATQFYQYIGEQYDYYFFDHMASISGVPPAEVLVHELKEAFKDKNFLFSDVNAILPAVDAILTIGNQPYQEFKLSLCPLLATIPRHIVQATKGLYITQTFGLQPTVLIDDKQQQNLPASTTFIHLDRSQSEPVIRKEGKISIVSLQYYQQALA